MTRDPKTYGVADTIILDVNLDVQKMSLDSGKLDRFAVDLENFEAATNSFAKHWKEDALIMVETTVPPGTCEKIVKPLIERELGLSDLSLGKYRLGHSY